jgi:hypothetical protein
MDNVKAIGDEWLLIDRNVGHDGLVLRRIGRQWRRLKGTGAGVYYSGGTRGGRQDSRRGYQRGKSCQIIKGMRRYRFNYRAMAFEPVSERIIGPVNAIWGFKRWVFHKREQSRQDGRMPFLLVDKTVITT